VATVYDRKLHERELAAEYYRRYIRTPDPNPELVKRATERLTGLKKEAEEEAAKRAALPPAGAGQGSQAGPAGPTAEEREDRLSASKTWHTIGIVTGAVGLLGVAGGVLGAGGAAKYYNDKANQDCNNSLACKTQQGVDDASKSGTWATISTVATAAGAGVLAIGIALYFAAPKPFPTAGQITIAPQIGSSGGGMSVAGTF
jgi:hypothetical protein